MRGLQAAASQRRDSRVSLLRDARGGCYRCGAQPPHATAHVQSLSRLSCFQTRSQGRPSQRASRGRAKKLLVLPLHVSACTQQVEPDMATCKGAFKAREVHARRPGCYLVPPWKAKRARAHDRRECASWRRTLRSQHKHDRAEEAVLPQAASRLQHPSTLTVQAMPRCRSRRVARVCAACLGAPASETAAAPDPHSVVFTVGYRKHQQRRP
jgi:hypothetical protein